VVRGAGGARWIGRGSQELRTDKAALQSTLDEAVTKLQAQDARQVALNGQLREANAAVAEHPGIMRRIVGLFGGQQAQE
jgi:hypothetical protein